MSVRYFTAFVSVCSINMRFCAVVCKRDRDRDRDRQTDDREREREEGERGGSLRDLRYVSEDA